MVEQELPKLKTGVRFSSPAPYSLFPILTNFIDFMIHIFVIIFSFLGMAIGAQVKLPIYSIPFTGQTYMLCLIILLDTKRWRRMMSLSLYLLIGLWGAPVFASATHTLTSPTGGYLWGMLLSTCIPPLFQATISSFKKWALFTTVGLCIHGIVLLSGGLQLSYFVGVSTALSKGVLPFLLPGLLKSAMAAATALFLEKVILRDQPSL